MDRPARKPYRTDLTDDQWGLLATVLPPAKAGGRPRAVDLREIVNALMYLTRTGCQWGLLPHDLPAKSTKVDPGNRTAGRTPLWGVWIAVIQGACE